MVRLLICKVSQSTVRHPNTFSEFAKLPRSTESLTAFRRKAFMTGQQQGIANIARQFVYHGGARALQISDGISSGRSFGVPGNCPAINVISLKRSD